MCQLFPHRHISDMYQPFGAIGPQVWNPYHLRDKETIENVFNVCYNGRFECLKLNPSMERRKIEETTLNIAAVASHWSFKETCLSIYI